MPIAHELTNIAVVALVALACGALLTRVRQPPVVGYILAGVVLGPSVLGLVQDQETVGLLAEMGVLMLLFVVGMELSLRAFRSLWRLAVVVMLLQVAVTLGVMMLLRMVMGWPIEKAVLLAFVVALSSTAVAIKMLEDIGELRTRAGRIAVGVLIAQDLAVVPMMLVLDLMAAEGLDLLGGARLVLALVLLFGLILVLSRRKRINLPLPIGGANQADLLPLTALVMCFGAAAITGAMGLSPAYGAFLAGLTIGNSNQRQIMLANAMPLQSVLIMVFFLSVGLLIDLGFLWANLGIVLVLLLVVTVLKTVVNIGVLGLLRVPWPRAFLSAVVLAQVGEFGFLLAGIAGRNRLISEFDFQLIVTVTALSLGLSPIWLATARRLHEIAAYRQARIKRVLRFVYGRQGRWLIGAGRGLARLGRRGLTALGIRLRARDDA